MIGTLICSLCSLVVAPLLGAAFGFLCALLRALDLLLRRVKGWTGRVDLEGQAVIVTGAGGGFGQAIVSKLLDQGAIVYALDIMSAEDAGKVLPLNTHPSKCRYRQVDVTKDEELQKFVQKDLRDKGIQVYGCINNAGISGFPAGAIETRPENIRKVMDVNFFAGVELSRLLFEKDHCVLRCSGRRCKAGQAPTRSRFVNVTSMAGIVAGGYMASYTASKHAFEAYSDSLRIEMSNTHFDVTLIEPYFAATGIYRHVVGKESDFSGSIFQERFEQSRERFQGALASNSLMTADSVGEVIIAALTEARPRDRYCVCPRSKEWALRLVMHLPNYLNFVDGVKQIFANAKKV